MMKQIDLYINEKLKLNRDTGEKYKQYNYFPQNKDELTDIINELVEKRGRRPNLNDIDTSEITDMSNLFNHVQPVDNIDISEWDVSHVENMNAMFYGMSFNCDLSGWDVSNVKDMSFMFYDCHNFNSDLSAWDVSNVTNMHQMFYNCTKFDSDLSHWDVRNVTDMDEMFAQCMKFSCDLSGWDISNVKNMRKMFFITPCLKTKPSWYKS